VTGWRKLYYEKSYNLCSLPGAVIKIKSRRLIWTRYVAQMGQKIGTDTGY
jgi:hypothetical protein